MYARPLFTRVLCSFPSCLPPAFSLVPITSHHYARLSADYTKARTLTLEAAALASKILDARLTLTRLRQAHPHPRLTIPAANAQLDAQIEEMQSLDDELQQVNAQVEDVKEKVKTGAREVERLRVERADLEKTVNAGQKEVQDGRVVGLYDWCVCHYSRGGM